jgi:hypothetical protein
MEDTEKLLRRQRIQKEGRVAQEAFIRSHLVAIDQNFIDGERKIGSATCIEIGERFFLCTAAHNFKCTDNGGTVGYVAPHASGGISLNPIRWNFGELGIDDTIDTAWVEIERESAERADLVGVPLSIIESMHMMDVENDHFLTVGIPPAFFKLTSKPDDEDNTPLFGYFTRPGIQANEIEDKIYLAYQRKALLPNGEIVDIPHPEGVSGGPIWLTPIYGEDEIWSTYKYRLIGFNTHYHREQIIGLRMHLWLKLLLSDLPDLEEYLGPVLARR